MVEDGDAAPEFELHDERGEPVTRSSWRGRAVVLYFYPKDDTSGCTKEAIDFSALIDEFRAAGAEVVGVSPDDTGSHRKFSDKHALKVRLLSDVEKTLATAYGVWVEKSMYGRKYMGVERSTFLIDKAGRVVRSWRKVKVPGHAEEVLAAVKALQGLAA